MRIWLKPERMAAVRHFPDGRSAKALARNNYLSALGRTKGSMVSVNLIANTDLPRQRSSASWSSRNKAAWSCSPWRNRRRSSSARRTNEEEVRFNGETATFLGVWVLPTANSLDVMRACARRCLRIEAQLPWGMKLGVPYDSTEYIQDAITKCCARSPRRCSSSSWSSFCSSLVPCRHHPDRRDPDLARRRRVS
jgi:multidrug efflux pump